MTVPPIIFDRKVIRGRMPRQATASSEFLSEAVEAEITARASLILRRFDRTLLCGTVLPRLPDQFGEIVAEGRDVVFDEELLPFAPESFDCIVSMLSFQTLNDLPGALAQMRRAIRPDGLLLACLFAGDTLKELRRSWLEAEAEERGGASPRVAPMIDLRELGNLLQRAGFAMPVTDLDRTMVRYSSALALMREIKALGFTNALSSRARRPVTRRLLARAAAIYERDTSDADGRVRATIDVAWLTAWVPHESQPQPLKPGSAKARLADALRVEEVPVKR